MTKQTCARCEKERGAWRHRLRLHRFVPPMDWAKLARMLRDDPDYRREVEEGR